MYFRDIYKPIPLVYNLVLAMLWRHPENVELDKVKVVHYCAAVSDSSMYFKANIYYLNYFMHMVLIIKLMLFG